MENLKLGIRYNIMDIESIETFTNIKGGYSNNCKDIYFVRMVGVSNTYLKDIEQMDATLTDRMYAGQGKYIRLHCLQRLTNVDDIKYYTACYENWKQSGHEKCVVKFNQKLEALAEIMGKSNEIIYNIFQNNTPHFSDSILRNFMIKLLYWIDTLGLTLLSDWNERCSYKVVLSGISKKQEYLFCYYLTLLGIDVMILLPSKDMENVPEIQRISKKAILGNGQNIFIPAYEKEKYEKPLVEQAMPRISMQDIRRDRVHSEKQTFPIKYQHRNTGSGTSLKNEPRRELEFEELALLASSVVMITVRNEKGKAIGTGSGIMVGKKGYILTNSHVACGGASYSVRIEDDEEIYETDEMIKYNQVLDLAIIRIDRTLKPLQVYNGKKELVRGQKVVAIGSPLGLFNSVSNGIISGFRKMDDVNMIQFTAPISHGSSGGAVLNMFGEVIGISTAGIDDGQNINLAVEYQYLNNFIRGFI